MPTLSKELRRTLENVVADTSQVQQLLPLVQYVKMDMSTVDPKVLAALAPRFKLEQKKLVAEKVETREEFKSGLDLGFDYFQGYYFAKPAIMTDYGGARQIKKQWLRKKE